MSEPLQTIIPSYLYQQYSDDENLQAFVDSYNAIAQGYLDWFNQTPLSVYTSPSISGSLLDWVAQGIYGIARPVFSTSVTKYYAGLNALPLNTVALNGRRYTQSGTATISTDDYYKRVLTWWLYLGDGRHFDGNVLRMKVARFLYGQNGSDISLDQAQTVHLQPGSLNPPGPPALTSITGGSIASTRYGVQQTYLTPVGQTLAGPPAALTVAANSLIVAQSPPAENGATAYDIYVNVLATNPGKFIAGINSAALDTAALNGTNKKAVSPPTKQNAAPIPLSPNLFVESDSLAAATLTGLTLASGGPSGAVDAEYTGTGSAAGANKTLSQVQSVTPGLSYTLSDWIDPSQVTNLGSNVVQLGLNTADGLTAITASYVTSSTAGRFGTSAWTCPENYATLSDDLTGWNNGNLTLSNGGPSGATDGEQTGTGGSGGTASLGANLAVVMGASYTPSFWVDQTYMTGGATQGQISVADITGFGGFGSAVNIAYGAGPARYAGLAKVIPINICPEPYSTWALTGSASASTQNATKVNTATFQQIAFATNADTSTSPLIAIDAGTVISISAQIVGAITAGSVTITAVDQTGTTIPGLSLSQTVNSNSRKSQSGFTVPTGVTGMKLVAKANGATFTGTVDVKTIQLTVAAADPGGYVSTSNPFVQSYYQVVSPVITSGQKLKVSQPMFEKSSTASGYYISSQNPQVQTYAQLLSSGIVTSGQKFKISQPMFRADGVSTPYQASSSWVEPTTGLIFGEALPTTDTSNTPANIIITIPAGQASTYFQQAMQDGILAYPFQLSAIVVIEAP